MVSNVIEQVFFEIAINGNIPIAAVFSGPPNNTMHHPLLLHAFSPTRFVSSFGKLPQDYQSSGKADNKYVTSQIALINRIHKPYAWLIRIYQL